MSGLIHLVRVGSNSILFCTAILSIMYCLPFDPLPLVMMPLHWAAFPHIVLLNNSNMTFATCACFLLITANLQHKLSPYTVIFSDTEDVPSIHQTKCPWSFSCTHNCGPLTWCWILTHHWDIIVKLYWRLQNRDLSCWCLIGFCVYICACVCAGLHLHAGMPKCLCQRSKSDTCCLLIWYILRCKHYYMLTDIWYILFCGHFAVF